jgi:hypothetical protein
MCAVRLLTAVRAGKHHQAYLDNMNKQIAGSNMESKSLEEVVLESWNNGSPSPVFNNAAQVASSSSRGRVRLYVSRAMHGPHQQLGAVAA